TYSTAGSYTASLTVKDSLGLASAAVTRSITVAVAGQKPVAVIDTPTINVSLLPGGKVSFKGSAEAGANLPLSYNWRFPGASPSSSRVQNPGSISYANAGVFTATLTLTDSKGNQSQAASRVVTVAKPNQTAPLVGQCSIGGSDEDHDDEDDDEDDEDDEDVKSTTERRSKNEN
ncbi:MAG: PKD domain-containing protein, partial [Rhodoferax sp.]